MDDRRVRDVGIAIFAKAPIAGFAKTRLIPHIGAAEAAALQLRLIRRTVAVCLAAKIGPVSLWCAPSQDHLAFRSLALKNPVALYDQIDGDLGWRMSAAFDVLTPSIPLLLIGVDCPPLTPSHLRLCGDRLCQGDDAVFLPTEDGGYALVGLRRPAPRLFFGIPWSTSAVMGATRARLVKERMMWSEPDILWDLDRPEDLQRAEALLNDSF